jgi:hypothetical protein
MPLIFFLPSIRVTVGVRRLRPSPQPERVVIHPARCLCWRGAVLRQQAVGRRALYWVSQRSLKLRSRYVGKLLPATTGRAFDHACGIQGCAIVGRCGNGCRTLLLMRPDSLAGVLCNSRINSPARLSALSARSRVCVTLPG